MATCPVCRKPAAARALNPAFPFCSERCKLVDLGKWLGEEYRIPGQHSDLEEDERPTGAPPASPRQDEPDDDRHGG